VRGGRVAADARDRWFPDASGVVVTWSLSRQDCKDRLTGPLELNSTMAERPDAHDS
jgi:hypothetical protein